mgnify:FL=1
MKNKLKDKVAVITGGSGGIGLAIAKHLVKKNVKVYDISKNMQPHEEYIKSFEGDVNDTKQIENILNEIFEENGHIDIFINNAGFGIAGAIENTKAENIYRLVNTNLSAVIALSGVAIPFLKKSGGGNIINISSVGGIIPLPFQATYSATKAGVEIFSKALANEVKPFNIKVTAILPGDTKTGFTQNRIVDNNGTDEDYKKNVEKSIKKVEKDEQTGKSPDSVGKAVCNVLQKKNPPLRKTVGFAYKLVVFLPRIFSTKLINFLVRKIYC